MAVVQNRFDAGSFGNAITVANSGGTASGNAFNVVSTLTGQTLTYDNVQNVREGYSMQAADGSTPGRSCVGWTTSIGTQTVIYLRFNIWIGGIDLNDSYYAAVLSGGATTSPLRAAIGLEVANQNLAIFDAAGVVIPGTEIPGNWQNFWIRIEAELALSTTAAPGSCIMRVYNNPNGTTPDFSVNNFNQANLGGSGDTYVFGICDTNNGPSHTQWMDNVGVSTVGFLGPATFDASTLDGPSVADANAKALLFTNVAVSDQTVVTELRDANVAVTLSESVKLLTEENAIASDVTSVGESFRISLLSISVSDSTSTTTDVLSVRSELNSSVSDALTTTDAAAATIGISVRESVATSENVAVSGLNIVVQETTTVSDSPLVTLGIFFVAVVDSTQASETASALLSAGIAKTETINTAEAVSVSAPLLVSASDATATTETASATVAITLSEFVAIGFVGPLVVSDSTATTESVGTSSAGGVSVSDATTTSDAALVNEPFAVIVAEATAVQDSPSAIVSTPQVVLAEATGTTEAFLVQMGFAVAVTDATSTTEAASAPFPSPISRSESIATSDATTVNTLGSFQVSVRDTTSLLEGAAGTGVLLVSVGDAASLPSGGPTLDENVSAADATATSEAVAVGLTDLFVSRADATAASEAVSADPPLSPFSILETEATSVSEWFIVGMPPVVVFTLEAVVADSLSVSESVARTILTQTYTVSKAEAVATSESATIFYPALVVNVKESTATQDVVSTSGEVYVTESDSTLASDANVQDLATAASVAETISSSDAAAAVQGLTAAVAEVVGSVELSNVNNDLISTSEASTTAEFVSVIVVLVISEAEATGVTDVSSFSGESFVSRSDVAASVESILVQESFTVTASDATTTLDSTAGTVASNAATSDTVATTDVSAIVVPVLLVGVTEVVANLERTNLVPLAQFETYIEESAGTRESATADTSLNVAAVEATSLVEVTALYEGVEASASDRTSTTESEALTFGSTIVANESVSSQDGATVASLVIPAIARETLGASDSPPFLKLDEAIVAKDTTTAADAPQANFANASQTRDTAGALDVPTARLETLVARSDATATSDSSQVSLEGLATASESVGTGEVVFLEVVPALSVVDAISSQESVQLVVPIATVVLDAAATTDRPSFSISDSLSRLDSATTTDAAHVNLALTASVADVVATTEVFAVRPDLLVVTNDSAKTTETNVGLPDLLLTAADSAIVRDQPFPGKDLFRFITDTPSSFEMLVAELSTGLQPPTGLENVGAKEYLALAIKSPWGPLLPADVVPTTDEGDVTSIWLSTYRPTQFMPS